MSPACIWPSPHSFFNHKCVPKNALQSKDNSEVVFTCRNLDRIFRRLPSRVDVCFGRPCLRLFSLLPDRLYLAQIFSTVFIIAAELRCHYMILISITLETYNLNSILITNVPTATHIYSVQSYCLMKICKTYADNI